MQMKQLISTHLLSLHKESTKRTAWCIIMPENKWLATWNLLITFVLIWSCCVTPVQIALMDDLSTGWTITNYAVDLSFLIDIIIIFNTALYDKDYNLSVDRGEIACKYMKGWFFIDLVAILPFELIIPTNGESANLVRFIRLGRLYKFVKLIKLVRLFRLKNSNALDIFEIMHNVINMTENFAWFIQFFLVFLGTTHILTCIWIIVGEYTNNEAHIAK